jgi:hypothetical protein
VTAPLIADLALAPGVDPSALIDALALAETNGGVNNCPRHEPSYMPAGESFWIQGRLVKGTGRNFNKTVAERWAQFGLPSSASYGPLQILYHVAADRGYYGAPWALTDPRLCLTWAVKHLAFLTHSQRPKTVEDYADAWNSGNCRDAFRPADYVAKVRAAYDALRAARRSP